MLGGEVGGGQVLAPGPGHSAADRSLSVKLDSSAPDGFLTHSFSGDDPIVCRDLVRQKLGLQSFKPNGGRKSMSADALIERVMQVANGALDRPATGKIVAASDYRDGDGTLLYQVLRYEPKTFRQRRPDGNGGYIYNLDGVQRVLYRYPDLLKFPSATIFVAEGEKDANRLWDIDLCATTVASGKWTEDCIQALCRSPCSNS
jgi:hypothetical protein